MSDLLFIRHAATDMAGRFCGHANPGVNARGHEQIQSLLRILESEQIDAVCASDLQRAVTTAEALASAFAIPSSTRPSLREIAFGQWEGLTWNEIEQRDPVYCQQWIEAYPNLPAPRGEVFEDFQVRVIDEVKRLLTISDHRRIAVVTHAGVMRVIMRVLCGLNEQQAWDQTTPYCCFFRYAPEVTR